MSAHDRCGQVLLVMGVSGSGKTTVGLALAEALGWRFVDGDDHHPRTNVERMAAGLPLDYGHREPWLAVLSEVVARHHAHKEHIVLACSALKVRYRDLLLDYCPHSLVIHLTGDPELIAKRMSEREGHFMKPTMLASQLVDLEIPEQAITVDIHRPVAHIVADVLRIIPGRIGGSR